MSARDFTEEPVERPLLPNCGTVSPAAGRTTPAVAKIPAEGANGGAADARTARLVRTIEGEIVPRLGLTRRSGQAADGVPPPVSRTQRPEAADVGELVRLLLAHDVAVASAFIETVRQRGATLEMICLDLLAPAARELGLLWEQDECDFMQVTVGLCRLHQLLRELSPEFRSEEPEAATGRRILLVPCPGEQHTFGITVVAQFLSKAGWEVWSEFPKNNEDVLDLVRQYWFCVVGLSVGCEGRVAALKATIGDIRRNSRNPHVGVLVGGPLLVAQPALAAEMGADASAVDGPAAVLRAELMRERRRLEAR